MNYDQPLETRVGKMTLSVLETECRKVIDLSYKAKDYETMLDYIGKYKEIKVALDE